VDGEHQFEVLSTNGDTFLCGEDFDNRLIDLLADDMASELVFKVKSANQSGLYGIFNDYISDILINFTSEQLDKLLNNKLIKEKE
jgi:molecular chaperone DnaK (HSP70)